LLDILGIIGYSELSKVKQKKEGHMSRTKTKKEIEFKYYAPDAKSVKLAGDFNNWDSQSLFPKKDKKGFWKVRLALTPGSYQYKFLVDGQWQNDPGCSSCVPNSFGSLNCEIDVK